jgi:tetratricopeptide (TPR) repeat protein
MSEAFETGKRLYQIQRYEKALEVFLSVDRDPAEDPELSYFLGLCYTRLERYEDALLHLEQVVTNHVDFLHLYQCRMLLAVIYSILERISLAEYEIKQLVTAGYRSPQVYSVYAYILYEKGEIDQSLEYLEEAVSMDPENPNVLNSLGYISAEQGRKLPEAERYVRRALEKQPENPAYLDSLGWVCFKQGKLDEAKRYLRRAQHISGGHELIKSHLNQVLDQTDAQERKGTR